MPDFFTERTVYLGTHGAAPVVEDGILLTDHQLYPGTHGIAMVLDPLAGPPAIHANQVQIDMDFGYGAAIDMNLVVSTESITPDFYNGYDGSFDFEATVYVPSISEGPNIGSLGLLGVGR